MKPPDLFFSIIIPVYNRPKEIDALLASMSNQNFLDSFEVLIIEDGSTIKSEKIVATYATQLNINYYFKENSGAGASRNFGMQMAKGNYFIILDSDVLLPEEYLYEVKKALQRNFTDAFGGPDAAHKSFTSVQKAINYAMTSLFTTGGIRGKKNAVGKFQPRSFNFGLSKKAFLATNGFSPLKYGEDIDLTFRLWQNGFQTQLIPKAYVYHKRRSTISDFLKQTYNFGTARPKLNKRYPKSAKITYWFPSLFILGFLVSILVTIIGNYVFLKIYMAYFLIVFLDSLFKNGIQVALLTICTSFTQFLGYGTGFLKSQFFR